MKEKILTGISFLAVSIFVITIWALLVQFIGVQDDDKATIIAGILGMVGGFAGAMGAYFAAKMQIDTQMERLRDEEKKKARPFILCNDFRANANLSDVELHTDSKIIDFDYYGDMQKIAKKYGEGKLGFFQLKFLGVTEVILNCEIKLILDKDKYEKSEYEVYLDHMKNDVEVFIPIPYVTQSKIDKGCPIRLELTYETVANEKFLYIYNFDEKYFKLFLIEEDFKRTIFFREFGEAQWILPGKKKFKK